jgi:selenium metabolism protein YedF
MRGKSMDANTVLFVAGDTLGQGPVELGERLAGAFFHALAESPAPPATVIFMNSGVKLATEGARTVADLQTLQAAGVEILACGTCLGYFELKDRLAVGKISNMYEIAGKLMEAPRVVSL